MTPSFFGAQIPRRPCRHYEDVAEPRHPVMVYNVPKFTGVYMPRPGGPRGAHPNLSAQG